MNKQRAEEICRILKRYELWRHGEDCRRKMIEAGIIAPETNPQHKENEENE